MSKNNLVDEETVDLLMDMAMDKNYFINKGNIVYSLKECLESTSDKVLQGIYIGYKIISLDKKDINLTKRNDIINLLLNELPNLFKDFLVYLNKEDIKTIEEYKKNGFVKNNNMTLTSNGFMYGYKEKSIVKYIVPNEFIIYIIISLQMM